MASINSKELLDKINLLNINEQQHILHILKSYDLKYTRNKNGCLFVINDSDVQIINKINNCVDLINSNREFIKEMDERRSQLITNYKQLISNKIKNNMIDDNNNFIDNITIKPIGNLSLIINTKTILNKTRDKREDVDKLITSFNNKSLQHLKSHKMYYILKKIKKSNTTTKRYNEHERQEDDTDILTNNENFDDTSEDKHEICDSDIDNDHDNDNDIDNDHDNDNDNDIDNDNDNDHDSYISNDISNEKLMENELDDSTSENSDVELEYSIEELMKYYKTILIEHEFKFNIHNYSRLLHQYTIDESLVESNSKRKFIVDKFTRLFEKYNCNDHKFCAYNIEMHIYNYSIGLYHRNNYNSNSIWNKLFEDIYIQKNTSIYINLNPDSYIKNSSLMTRYLNQELSEKEIVYGQLHESDK